MPESNIQSDLMTGRSGSAVTAGEACSRRTGRSIPQGLTAVDIELLECIAEGYTAAEAAREIGIKLSIAAGRLARLRDRLGLTSMPQVYILSGAWGWALPPYVPGREKFGQGETISVNSCNDLRKKKER